MNIDDHMAELLAAHPAAGPIFQRHQLDFCCGAQDLRTACLQAGLDPEAVWQEVLAAERPAAVSGWADRPLAELIDHIIGSYHEPLRREMPELIDMAVRVERVHALHDLCPAGLAATLEEAHAAILDHLAKEEQVLFPAIRDGHGSECDGPVHCMRHEHDEHSKRLDQIRRVTHDFSLPDAACTTWRVLYQRLATLEEDLGTHIQLENEILFPRALAG